MNKKTISWITPSSLIDVDLPIIKQLQHHYKINWQIVIANKSSIDYERYVYDTMQNSDTVNLSFVYLRYRNRDPRNIVDYIQIVNNAKKEKPSIFYISFFAMPYGIFIYRLLLPIKRCVIACHNVSTPKGASSESFTRIYTDWVLSTFNNIQVFSNGQKEVLESRYCKKNVLMAPLAIKDYGESEIRIDKDDAGLIKFLNFGNIVDYKRVDLLIEVGNKLYEKGVRNFKIVIAGKCGIWESKYASLIKYPDVFELYIKRIPNEDVADLFAQSHYFVLPYQDIAQSGAITVAFRYNLPTIVSDIPQFEEFVENNVTGITFKNGSADDLADKMKYLIDNHAEIYSYLSRNQAEYVEKELSLQSIINKYVEYLDKI